MEKGSRSMLMRVLQRRFGPLRETVRRRVEEWPADKLEELVESALSATSLSELGLDE